MATEFIVLLFYQVLYTHQKQKKAKTWHDGILKASSECKKATLFDDKGSRLDSIYIVAGDITLGEQLESDRYYILVEDINKPSVVNGTSLQQKANSLPSSSPGGVRKQVSTTIDGRVTLQSSQGRCSGLKRKKSGFVPPRMVKAPKQETDDKLPHLFYNNECQNHIIQQSLPNMENSPRNSILSDKLLENKFGESDIKKKFNESAVLKGSNCDNLPLFSAITSPKASYLNHLQKVCLDSQESTDSESKLKSPWSVYGSNKNSPKTDCSPKVVETRNIDLNQVSKPSDCEVQHYARIASAFGRHSFEEKHHIAVKDKQMNSACDSIHCQSPIAKYNIKPCDEIKDISTQLNKGDPNSLQSKRSMTEIMHLLNSKVSSSVSTNCGVSDEQRLTENETKRSDNNSDASDKIVQGHLDATESFKTVKNISKISSESSDTVVLGSDPTDMSETNESEKSENLNSDQLKAPDTDFEANASFDISYSPLSNVTDSDDEPVRESTAIENSVIKHPSLEDLQAAEYEGTQIDISANECRQSKLNKSHQTLKSNEIEQPVTNVLSQDHVKREEENTSNKTGVYKQNICDSSFPCRNSMTDLQQLVPVTESIIESEGIKCDPVQKVDDTFVKKVEINDFDTQISNIQRVVQKENNVMDNFKSVPQDSVQCARKTINYDNTICYDSSSNTSGLSGDPALKKCAAETMEAYKQISESVEDNYASENTGNENHTEKCTVKSGFNDLIDLIDTANAQSKYLVNFMDTETFELGSIISDKASNDNLDKKTTQSQDTMDYTCDTLSNCNNSQQSSDYQVPVVPELGKMLAARVSKFSPQNQKLTPQAPYTESLLVDHENNQPSTLCSLNDGQNKVSEPFIDSVEESHSHKSNNKYMNTTNTSFGMLNGQTMKSKENQQKYAQENTGMADYMNMQDSENAISEQVYDSILTQIDLSHDSRKAEPEQGINQEVIADKITTLQASRANIIPVSQYPHPSELFGRNVKKKAKKCERAADIDMWGRANTVPFHIEKRSELSAKINERLKGYKINGSICSGASRYPYTESLERTPASVSPYHRLDGYDGDISTEASPSLFEDYGERKAHTMEKITQSPHLAVPEMSDTECSQVLTSQPSIGLSTAPAVNKPGSKGCVFISDSDASKDCSPTQLLNPVSYLDGEDTDEDFIYTQIYKPRLMVPGQCAANTEDESTDACDSQNDRPQVKKTEAYLDNESSVEFFTQPKYMSEERKCVSGGLHLCREEHKAAVRSKPFDDIVRHTSYQNFSVPSKCEMDKASNTGRFNEVGKERISNENYQYFNGSLETSVADIPSKADHVCNSNNVTLDEEYLDSYKMNDIISHSGIYKYKDAHFDILQTDELCNTEKELSDSNLSSPELAEIMRRAIKPAKKISSDNTENDMAKASKWEKYNSQKSEEDISLDVAALKSKVKDFTVIEKLSEINGKHSAKIQKCDTTRKLSDKQRTFHSVTKKFSQFLSVEKQDKRLTQTPKPCKIIETVSPESTKLLSSFSSMDSFEKMLANDNLDFNDPDLDKVLTAQALDKQTTGQLNELSKEIHDYKKEIKSIENVEKEAKQTESLYENHINSISLSEIVKSEINTDSDRTSADLDVRNTCNQRESGSVSLKRLSSDLDNSFSLDDSFLESDPFHNTAKKAEIKTWPSSTLRVPWKQNVTSTVDNENNIDEIDTKQDNIDSDKDIKAAGTAMCEVKMKRFENNFMGYDGEDDSCLYSEDRTNGERNDNVTQRNLNILRKNAAGTALEMKTKNISKVLTQSSSKVNPRAVSSQLRNPVIQNDLSRCGSSNHTTKLNKRFNPPASVGNKLHPFGRGILVSPTPELKFNRPAGDLQAQIFSSSMSGELKFPSSSDVQISGNLMRQVSISQTFTSVAAYKNILIAAMTEYLNLQFYDLAKRFHHALSKVDTSELTRTGQGGGVNSGSLRDTGSRNPCCHCGAPTKVVQVKKQGPNNGRFFYACSSSKQQQCKFFQWLDERSRGGFIGGRLKISDPHSLITHMKSQRVQFYSPCSLITKYRENIQRYLKSKYKQQRESDSVQKKQLYLKLSHKGHSSLYSKDDVWVISQHQDFSPQYTFFARSTYYGPTSSSEVELEPLAGYCLSNWSKEVVCHALLAGNATTELSCLDNIKDHISQLSPPVIPSLLSRQVQGSVSSSGFQMPRMIIESNQSRNIFVHSEEIDELVRAHIEDYHLNEDQAEAIKRVGSMFSVEKSDSVDNVLLIHGVFGAGKSFLLSVIVLFLVKVFQRNDLASPREPFPWKLLISSTTNVAVDRILQGLLDLGFEDFIRVGSVTRIAKPILPYSVHATGTDNQELKDFQEMLRSGELTAAERQSVRQGIDKLRKGENKKKLTGVRVVGVTCASCQASCISSMQFPLVLLDECSQMTEPSSLLPIARFGCQKLLLVGDPKQLDPTIQGSDSVGEEGLEQTMFDRLIKAGYIPTLLRTQYRCHPDISAAANKLFYSGMLIDGVSAVQRAPVLPELPTICLYDVDRGQECCEGAGSYFNEQEAQFVVFLLAFLMSCEIEPTAVGVITLYKSQMARITDLLNSGIAEENKEIRGVQVSTVDAFQGGEKDIIILSTVRAQATGFIDNDKRINVALTRARHHLLMVGNYRNLSRNLLWEKIIDHCRGFQNGIQSADEARYQLEIALERMKQDGSLPKRKNDSCQTSEKNLQKKKSVAKRNKKTVNTIGKSPNTSQPASFDGDILENQDSVSSRKLKRKNANDQTKSPQFSLSVSSDEMERSSDKQSSSAVKRSRHADRLNPDLFDGDDSVSSADDLMPFEF